jgi:hypothetical protein
MKMTEVKKIITPHRMLHEALSPPEYKQFCRNFDTSYCQEKFLQATNAADALAYGFWGGSSKEGYEYWHTIYDLVRRCKKIGQPKPLDDVMCFSMRDNTFGTVRAFTEHTAPSWLTRKKTVKGSTMDDRWFWQDRVLVLAVGESIQTDFQTITRTR